MKFNHILSCVLYLASCVYANAQTWADVKGGVNGGMGKMIEYNDKLFIAVPGTDTVSYGVDNIPAFQVASWDGFNWDTLKKGTGRYDGAAPMDWTIYNGNLVAGGDGNIQFGAWPNIKYAPKIFQWDSINGWDSLIGQKIPDYYVYAVEAFQGNLYAGGSFDKVGSLTAKGIAKWDGTNWSNIGNVNWGWEEVWDMAVYDNRLIIAGDFGRVGSVNTNYIAAYDGSLWKALGSGMDAMVYRLATDTINNFLYAGGIFSYADGKPAYVIARWDGEKWGQIGNGVTIEGTQAMTMYNKKLFIGSVSINGLIQDTVIISWDGKKWDRIHGVNSTVSALHSYKEELYVGGGFDSVPGFNVRSIARYSEPPNTSCDYLQAVILGAMDTIKYSGDSAMVQLKNNIKGASSWAWSFGDGETGSGLNPVHYYTSPGSYPVQVIVNYEGCIDTTTATVIVTQTTGIKKQIIENAFKVFPNPAKEEITIQIEGGAKLKDPRIEIYDVGGKKVKEISEIKGKEVKISLTSLNKGVYFVKLKDKEGREYSAERVIIK